MKIIAIVGPTGVGKTQLSIELAKRFNGEIINADSCQVYSQMNIGTAKITEEEKEGIKHHLFDIKLPSENYTVYDYQKDARKKIKEISERGKSVILVGGTGLYLKAALYDYEFPTEEEKYSYDTYTTEELYQMLLAEDPNTSIHANNRKRIERALTKKKNHSDSSNKKDIALYDVVFIGLTTDRKTLYSKINDRVDKMMEDGLEKEALHLYTSYKEGKPFQTAIGYKEFVPYFEKECTLEEVIQKIKQNSRHYAKRQYTFFRHQLPVHWFTTNYENFNETIQNVCDFLTSEGLL